MREKLLTCLVVKLGAVGCSASEGARKRLSSAIPLMQAQELLQETSSVHIDDNETRSFTRIMLDDAYQYWNLTEYPSDDFEELLKCMRKWEDDDDDDITLESAIEAQWLGFYELYLSNGTRASDPNATDDYWGVDEHPWFETYSDIFGSGNRTYLITQRCNYVSNLAYYRSARAICDYDEEEWFSGIEYRRAAKNAMMTLAYGSCFFHGSETQVGWYYDVIPSAALTYLIYQYMIQSFDNLSPVLLTMEDDPDSVNSSLVVIDLLTNFSLNHNTTEWLEMINATFPGRDQDVFLTYATTVSMLLTITLPWRLANFLIETIASALITDTDFLFNTYVPELKSLAAAEDLPIPFRDGVPIMRQFLGFVFGFAWALMWNEENFLNGFYGGFGIIKRFGPRLSTFLNRVGESIHGYEQTDPAFQGDGDVYPGATFCNKDSSHSVWHQQTAATYHNFVFVGDSVNRVLTNRRRRK